MLSFTDLSYVVRYINMMIQFIWYTLKDCKKTAMLIAIRHRQIENIASNANLNQWLKLSHVHTAHCRDPFNLRDS